MLQFRVTAQLYLENKRKIHPRGMRACQPKRHKEKRERETKSVWGKETPGPLTLLFMFCFFSSPGPALCLAPLFACFFFSLLLPRACPLFGSSFCMFFLFFAPPPGLASVYWASQECCLFYLRSSLWSLALPLFYFRGLFPSLSFSHHHSGLLFPILTT